MRTVGIDIGTTTICGVLLDAAGEARAVTRPNTAALPSRRRWEALQDPAVILGTAGEILAVLCPREPPDALCVTGQMHGILYLNGKGEPVSPLITWQDGRGGLPCHDGMSCADYLSERAGTPVYAGYGLCTHFYNITHGMAPAAAARLCTIGDYIAMRLAGGAAPKTDASLAASLGLFDVRENTFHVSLLEELGIPPELLPEVVASGTALGGDAYPVYCACGDHQASFYGAVERPGEAVSVNIGTGSQLSVFSREYREAKGMETRPFPGGGYLLAGASVNGGKAYASLAAFYREVCRLFAGTVPGDAALYQAMERAARETPERGGRILASAAFCGTRAEPSARGFFQNLDAGNFTPGHVTDALLEAMAAELCAFWESLEISLRAEKKRLVFSGNGARKNALLREKIAARCGLPAALSPVEEEAAYGAARLALDAPALRTGR